MENLTFKMNAEFGVNIAEAHQHARFVKLTSENSSWREARLTNQPDILYDISAAPLLYQFYVIDRFSCVGVIRIAADKRLGSPIISQQSERTVRPDYAALKRLTIPKAEYRLPEYRAVDAYPVIYSYPKPGIQVVLVPIAEPDASPYAVTVVFDAETLSVVEELPEGAGGPPGDSLDGNEAYSLLRRADGASFKIGQDPRSGEGISGMKARSSLTAGWANKQDSMTALLNAYDEAEGGAGEIPCDTEEHFLATTIDSTEGHFPAYAQIETYHCALASAQMIIEYLTGNPIDQRDLETPFNLGPFGTSNQAQINGYNQLLDPGAFTPSSLDKTPTPDEVADVIDMKLPMKSGVPRHARACCGYRRRTFTDTRTKNTFESFDLLIHDPWPPKEGKVYWENWNDIFHTNFIYMTRKSLVRAI